MIVAIILLIGISGIMCISLRYRRRLWNVTKQDGLIRMFYPMALWIIEKMRKQGVDLCSEKNAVSIRNKNILGGDEDNLKYTVRKLAQALMVLSVVCFVVVIYGLFVREKKEITVLTRPGFGQDEFSVNLKINDTMTRMELQPRLYDYQTIEKNFVLAYQELLERIPGENTTLSNVTKNLVLPTYLDKYEMSVSWYSDNYEVVNTEGIVYNRYFSEGQTQKVRLTATLSCQEYSCMYQIDIVVAAPLLDSKERIVRNAEAQIWERNISDRFSDEIPLPQIIEGQKVIYERVGDDYQWVLMAGGVMAAIVVFVGRDSDLRKNDKKRKMQMLMDYPEIVSKLTILMGAGMSARHAWEKLVMDYQKKKIKRYAYEEMVITCNEIRSGTMEGIAYSNFGKRCNIHEYLKLGAMLEQNVKSGTKGLAAMLEAEAWMAFEVRKNTAVKLGEEAGTKLLLPMILMLGIVLVIVMVPALMSLGI